MPLYKKKPVTIEARQTPENESEYHEQIVDVMEWIQEVSDHGVNLYLHESNGYLAIVTLEGAMTVKPGWWVIKGVPGEFYPCDPDIFDKTYEFIGPRGYDAPYMVN